VKKRTESWLSTGVVSVNKLLHWVWNVQLALCGSFSSGKELFEDKRIGRRSLPCKSSRGFQVWFKDRDGVTKVRSIAKEDPVAGCI